MRLAFGYALRTQKHEHITLSDDERLRSAYIIGSTGSGKSSLLETMVVQDVDGVGFGVFDPEERLSERTLRHLKDAGREPLVIDPTIGPVPLNLLSVPHGVHPHTVVEGVISTFQRYWYDSWGPRSEDIVRHCLLALMEQGLTLGELPRLLSNQAFRERVAEACDDERVRLFFLDHLRGISAREYRVWIEAVRNKAGALLGNPFLAPCLSAETCLDFQAVLDSGTPLVVNLSEKTLGDSGRILGALLVSRLFHVALRRPEGARPYFLYLDEFQNIMTRSLLDLITRARKRGLGLVLAHQTAAQPPFDRNPEYLSTILNNVATMVVMQVGREDAERFAKELFPATGTEAKGRAKHWLWGDFGPIERYSVQEEREHQCQEIEGQVQRECFIKIRARGVYAAQAYDLPEPRSTPEEAAELARVSVARHGLTLDAVLEAQTARIARFGARRG